MSESTQELTVIKTWKARIAFIMMIITPTLAVAGTYWKLKLEISDNKASVNEKISDLELQQEKSFADKESLKEIQKDVKQLTNDMTEVKTLLKRKL